MQKFSILFFSLFVLTFFAKAQDSLHTTCYNKFNNNFDVDFSTSASQSSVALAWSHLHPISKSKKFKIGYGIRFTTQTGKNLYYSTAPAKLTSKQSGPQVLFSPIYNENIDSFFTPTSKNNSLNLSINLQYTISKKFDVGFNIDAVGLSFGKSVTGKYISYQSKETNSAQTAKPTSTNLLLVSDNDLGMLNSELYGKYKLNKKWSIKFGATFLFTEYTTTNKLRLNNDRWRNKSLMGMVGISYSPF